MRCLSSLPPMRQRTHALSPPVWLPTTMRHTTATAPDALTPHAPPHPPQKHHRTCRLPETLLPCMWAHPVPPLTRLPSSPSPNPTHNFAHAPTDTPRKHTPASTIHTRQAPPHSTTARGTASPLNAHHRAMGIHLQARTNKPKQPHTLTATSMPPDHRAAHHSASRVNARKLGTHTARPVPQLAHAPPPFARIRLHSPQATPSLCTRYRKRGLQRCHTRADPQITTLQQHQQHCFGMLQVPAQGE